MRRDFFDIAEYARSKRFALRLFTNGIMINPAVADRIAKLHPQMVEFSVYSVHPEVHDKITRLKRSHELTLRALRLLHTRGVHTIMKTVMMRENFHELHALEALAKDLGATFKYDASVLPKNSGDLSPLKHRMTDEDLLWLYRETLEPDNWANRPAVTDDSRTCSIGLNSITIDPYGNVTPCTMVRGKAGNLRNRSLRAIWEESPLWNEMSHLTIGDLPVCRTCELKGICLRCHGMALGEQGDIRAPSLTNCRQTLIRRKVLIEQGVLPPDYPIPAHLQSYVEVSEGFQDVKTEGAVSQIIPLETLGVYHRAKELAISA